VRKSGQTGVHNRSRKRLTPSADESANFADSGSRAVELSAYSGRTRFGCEEAEIVSRTNLTEREENTVYNGERRKVVREAILRLC
jgi:hypothetical protein